MPRSPSPSPPRPDPVTWALPADAGPALLALARWSIESALLPEGAAGPEPGADEDWLDREGACFVTLTTRGALHGCIGSVVPHRTLRADVVANARAAAFRDRRFPALTRAELADTAVEVSVLSPLAPLAVRDEADALVRLRPGVDGVVLDVGARRSTFLPQVWTKVPDPAAFLAHLRLKAGLPPDYWSDEVRLSRYTVTEFHEER